MKIRKYSATLFAPLPHAVLLILLATRFLSGQVSGNIAGYVRDPSGAGIPNASVTATMIEQQTSRTITTNEEGFYNFVGMPNGHYQITFEAKGFDRQVHSNLELTVHQNLRVDARLSLGAVGAQLTVDASAPLVDTISPTLSGLIDDRRVVDLPLNGRNIVGLAAILPGVLNVTAPQQMNNARGGPEMNVSGGRPNMNLFMFDGGYFNNPSRNTGLNYPPPDAIQEVRILTHNFNAEYGHNPGSQVEVVSKSGTNEFHGSAWEFLRNEDLNARNFFSPRVPVEKQNQFGAAAGAPILKDKLFVFGSYQGLRDHAEAQSTQAQVPLDAQRAGNFTGLGVTLTNPTNPVTGAPFTDAAGRPCVAGNIIASGCISPVAQNFLQYVPASASGQVVSLAANPRVGDMFMIRADWNQSEKHRIFGHFFYDHNTHDSPFAGSGNLPGYNGETFAADTRQVTVNDTYTFRPNLLNQAIFTYLDTNSNELGTTEINPSAVGINMPQYVPGGAISLNVGNNFVLGSGYPTRFLGHNYQFKDSLNWIKGRHNFKFGYELLHLAFQQIWIGSPNFY
ncbi:MAG TPA: carboxypeptidase-like regulatory domain-containing protein, partial [Bryobacteraceae bacterium]|nr:carboxypeptidase-like regulatory domain-containing protein [Bryobacteraceae bacterium]